MYRGSMSNLGTRVTYPNLVALLDSYVEPTVNTEELIRRMVEDFKEADKEMLKNPNLEWLEALDNVTNIYIKAGHRIPYSRKIIVETLPYFVDMESVNFLNYIEVLEDLEQQLGVAYQKDKERSQIKKQLRTELSFLPSVPETGFPGGEAVRKMIVPFNITAICQNLDENYKLTDLRKIAKEEFGLVGVDNMKKADICKLLAKELKNII